MHTHIERQITPFVIAIIFMELCHRASVVNRKKVLLFSAFFGIVYDRVINPLWSSSFPSLLYFTFYFSITLAFRTADIKP